MKLSSSSSSSQHSPSSTIDDSPKLTPSGKHFDDLIEVTSGQKKINESAKKFIRKRFSRQDPSQISADLLAQKIDIIARDKIANEMSNSRPTSLDEVIRFIQGNNFLFSNIQRRLSVIQNLLTDFAYMHGKRTPRLTELYKSLEQLLNQKTLLGFIVVFQNIRLTRNKESKEIWKLIELAFQDKKGNSDPVLSLILRWKNPSVEDRAQIEEYLNHEAKLSAIPGLRLPWSEDAGAAYPINQILVDDVIRSIFPSDRVLLNSITINDKEFHSESSPCTLSNQELFFESLFCDLYKAAKLQIRDREIRRDVTTLMSASKMGKENLVHYLKSHPLPVLDMLRCYTMSCWGHCDFLFRQKFSGLFGSPFYGKLMQGIDCAFQVKSLTDFSVTMTKSYAIYFRLDPDKEERFPAPDMNKKLCTVTIDWEMWKENASWQGALKIKDMQWESNISYTDQKTLAEIIIPQDLQLYTGPSASSSSSSYSYESSPIEPRSPSISFASRPPPVPPRSAATASSSSSTRIDESLPNSTPPPPIPPRSAATASSSSESRLPVGRKPTGSITPRYTPNSSKDIIHQ